MSFNKMDNEDEETYIWRICNNKDLIGTWEDVCKILNKELGHNYGESFYRKMYQNFSSIFNSIKDKYLEDDYAKLIDEKTRNLEKARQKLFATKSEYSRNIRKQSRFELFYENVKNSIQCLETPVLKDNRHYKNNNIEYILTIADIHCGANFKSENNVYSFQECKRRFEKLLSDCICFIEKNNISHLNILELGDSIQGILRISDLKLNETSVVEATVYVAQLISEFLNKLSSYCYIDYYHCPTSNHSQTRNLNSKASELATEDIEYVISNYIKDVLKNNPYITVHTNFGSEYIELNIYHYNIIAMHGHQIKNINDSLHNLSQLHRKFYDIVFLAHYHGGTEIIVGESNCSDTEVLICPSFIGSDPYSDRLLKGSKASCKIFGIDKLYGHTETYKIILN